MLAGFFQVLFMFYLINRFGITQNNPLLFLYLSLSLSPILAGVFNPLKFSRTHFILSAYYFSFLPCLMLVFGHFIYNSEKLLAFLSIIFGLVYILGESAIIFYHKNISNTPLEVYSFLMLSFWIMAITFM